MQTHGGMRARVFFVRAVARIDAAEVGSRGMDIGELGMLGAVWVSLSVSACTYKQGSLQGYRQG